MSLRNSSSKQDCPPLSKDEQEEHDTDTKVFGVDYYFTSDNEWKMLFEFPHNKEGAQGFAIFLVEMLKGGDVMADKVFQYMIEYDEINGTNLAKSFDETFNIQAAQALDIIFNHNDNLQQKPDKPRPVIPPSKANPI